MSGLGEIGQNYNCWVKKAINNRVDREHLKSVNIPGSMTAPGFIVRGTGNPLSLNSASHGAGRQMSRTKAKANLNMKMLKQELSKNKVTLFGGGLDEAPQAYKNIHDVMAAQQDLVEVIGRFLPKIVRMDK